MRKGILFFAFVFSAVIGFAQPKDISPDSIFWRDTVWKSDIPVLTDQVYHIREQLLDLPLADSVYVVLEPTEISKIKELDSLYIEELLNKKSAYQKNTLQYKRRMQAYAYLSTDLALDILLYCPKTYELFVNTFFKVHPFGWNKDRGERASQIIEDLKLYLDTVDSEHLSLLLKLTEELKNRKISTANRIMKGSPSKKESYYHDLIDALLLVSRLAFK